MGNTVAPERRSALKNRFHEYDQKILDSARNKNGDIVDLILKESENKICCLGIEHKKPDNNRYMIHLMRNYNNVWYCNKSFTLRY